jgi:hypothetical protein
MSVARTIYSLSLALLVLISSTSFQVGMHFCQGEVREIALFSKASGCEKERELPPCHRHTKSSCCDDETVMHEADDLTASGPTVSLDAPDQLHTDIPFVLISEVIPSVSFSRSPFVHYRPPLLDGDLIVAYRSLII